MHIHERKFVIVLVGGGGIAAGLAAGWLLFARESGTLDLACRPEHALLNPGLYCSQTAYVVDKKEYRSLKEEIAQFIVREERAGAMQGASVYFRDLIAGPTFGVEEDKEFSPASLFKIPLLIAYLKIAETNPEILSVPLTLRPGVGEVALPPSQEAASTIAFNVPYAVNALLEKMIIYSDNRSKNLLKQHLERVAPEGSDALKETYIEMGLAVPDDDQEDFLTVKQYASLFRILYHASYLSEEMSERALTLLSQTTYTHGIVAGLPKEVQAAHKFGERDQASGVYQLHDCGIVYYPGNPYLLCVMTRGKDAAALPPIIQKVSKMVYEEVDSRRLR